MGRTQDLIDLAMGQLRDLIDNGIGGGLVHDVDNLECDVSELQDRCASAEGEIERLRNMNAGLLEVITSLMVNAHNDEPAKDPATLTWDDPVIIDITPDD